MNEILITAPDWELLRIQKLKLLELIWDDTDNPLWGIVYFLDAIQDSGVESGIWTEQDIFGKNF